MKIKSTLIYIFILFSLVGCTYTETQYLPPKTPGSDSCIIECEQLNNECKIKEGNFNFKYNESYKDCLNNEKNEFNKFEDFRMNKPLCLKPVYDCDNFQNTRYFNQCRKEYNVKFLKYNKCKKVDNKYKDIKNNKFNSQCKKESINLNCNRDYKRCFKNCGGRIEYIEKDIF